MGGIANVGGCCCDDPDDCLPCPLPARDLSLTLSWWHCIPYVVPFLDSQTFDLIRYPGTDTALIVGGSAPLGHARGPVVWRTDVVVFDELCYGELLGGYWIFEVYCGQRTGQVKIVGYNYVSAPRAALFPATLPDCSLIRFGIRESIVPWCNSTVICTKSGAPTGIQMGVGWTLVSATCSPLNLAYKGTLVGMVDYLNCYYAWLVDTIIT